MKSTPDQREALREVAVGREGPLGEALIAVLDDLGAAIAFREWLDNRSSWACTNDAEWGAASLACEAAARFDGDTERADKIADDFRWRGE